MSGGTCNVSSKDGGGFPGKHHELESKIGHVPVFFKHLAESDPAMHDAVLKLDSYIWADGLLSRKQKKLTAIAWSVLFHKASYEGCYGRYDKCIV